MSFPALLRPLVPLLSFGALLLPGPSYAQSVPGFAVSQYATVTDPVMLSFGPDGSLYVGRDPAAGGSATPVLVSKVGPGGAPVTSLGNVSTSDPDTVLLDVEGTISGVPGTLLVSGLLTSGAVGHLSGIRPDGTVVTLYAQADWANIVEMKFDNNGRFLFTAVESRSIWSSTGGTPTVLATLPGSAYPTYFTVAPDNRIAVGSSDGVVRIYNANGTLANASFVSFASLAGLEYGKGGAFGNDLYAIDASAGTLVRVNAAGVKTTIGTGFATGNATKDLAFGPSGDLFVSVNTIDRVLRIAAPWTNLGFALAGSQGLPQMAPAGGAGPGAVTTFPLSQAAQSSFGALVLGVTRVDVPLFGGVLVPNTDVLLPYATTAGGTASPSVLWPLALPAGIPIHAQAWTFDPAAVEGISASNASRTISR
ncbi:MAG: hypothetical protein GC161_02450 [Planctomycetaceae bacterium]|nr:hypothetical protein [Planctomycetaceae bacterium]